MRIFCFEKNIYLNSIKNDHGDGCRSGCGLIRSILSILELSSEKNHTFIAIWKCWVSYEFPLLLWLRDCTGPKAFKARPKTHLWISRTRKKSGQSNAVPRSIASNLASSLITHFSASGVSKYHTTRAPESAHQRTRTRTNTNPNDTEANAAGRSVRACVARKSKS